MYGQVVFKVTLRYIYTRAFRLNYGYRELEYKFIIKVSSDDLLCVELIVFWVFWVGPMPISFQVPRHKFSDLRDYGLIIKPKFLKGSSPLWIGDTLRVYI